MSGESPWYAGASDVSEEIIKFDRGALVRLRSESPKVGLCLPAHLHGVRQAMTVAEVADLLKVSERHIYQLVAAGTIPHFKIGTAVRFDPDTLATWLQKQMDEHRA